MSLTPESLIQSLHSHLAHHANLLPQLHAQLGLPPSAITTEFEQLQQTLCEVVEKQITSRQDQVELWMRKCDTIETECINLTKSLGGNATRALQSVGELKKILILPKRYDQLLTHQERLTVLYQEKYDQLTALNTRLLNLSCTLGASFFPPDLLHAPTAAMSTDQQSSSLNSLTPVSHTMLDSMPSTTSLKPSTSQEPSALLSNVTPERFQLLAREVSRGKSEIQRRLSHLASTLELVVWLYAELGIALPSSDVSSSLAFKDIAPPPSVVGLNSPLLSIARSDTPHKVDHDRILARFVARWEEAENEALEGDVLGVEGVDPTTSVMEWAETLKSELEDLKAVRESRIQAMYDQLEPLWKRLGKPEDEIDTFVESNKGSTEANVHAYEVELEHMLDLKGKRMSLFITNAREEIVGLWEDLILGEAERELFVPFNDTEHTEELLAVHEQEITRLKEERRIRAPLLASITKYFDICEEERKLAESAADQSRLLGRGPRGDPGRLLREERMRKRVKKEKPRLEQELLQMVPTWEAEYDREFLINGIRVMDVLMESVDEGAEKENNKKSASAPRQHAHKVSIPSRARTPSTNLGSLGAGEMHSIRKHATTPSTLAPNKRQKLNTGGTAVTTSARQRSVTPTLGISTNTTRHAPTPLGVSSILNAPLTTTRAKGPKGAQQPKGGSSSTSTPASNIRNEPLASLGGTKHYDTNFGLGLPGSLQNRKASASGVRIATSRAGSHAVSGVCRTGSGTVTVSALTAKRKARESFKPRGSVDSAIFGMGGLKNLGKANLAGGVPAMLSAREAELVEEDEGLFPL